MLPALPLIGYVAHVVSNGCLHRRLDGPVFGGCVATYTKTFATPTLFATSVADEAEKVSLYDRWPAEGVQCKIMVYHAIDGALKAVLKTAPSMLSQYPEK